MTYNYCYEGLNYEGLTYYESINEYIKMTFFMISFLPFVSIFSTWIVARFIWLPYVKKVRNTKYVIEFNKEFEVKYEDKYPIPSPDDEESSEEECSDDECSDDEYSDEEGADSGSGVDENGGGEGDGDGSEGGDDDTIKVEDTECGEYQKINKCGEDKCSDCISNCDLKQKKDRIRERDSNGKKEKVREIEPEDVLPKDYKYCLTNYVIDNTPEGNVLMRYNYNDNLFEYWSDTNVIKYAYLQTVTRKYVLTFDCIPLYKDRHRNVEDKKEREEIEKEEEEKRKEEQEKMKQQDNDKNYDSDEDLFVSTKPMNGKKNGERKIYDVDCNNYRRCGKIKDFFNDKKKVNVIENEKSKFTFADFKLMFEEKGAD